MPEMKERVCTASTLWAGNAVMKLNVSLLYSHFHPSALGEAYAFQIRILTAPPV